MSPSKMEVSEMGPDRPFRTDRVHVYARDPPKGVKAMSAVVIVPSLLPMIVVAAMRRAERRIYRQLDEARAFAPESAIPLTVGRSIDRRRLECLVGAGAVRLNAGGLHYLDTDGWTRFQRQRRRRRLRAMSVALALIGVGIGVFLLTR